MSIGTGLLVLDVVVGISLFIQRLRLGAPPRDELLDREVGVGSGVTGESTSLAEEPIGDLTSVPNWYVPSRPYERRDLPAPELHHRRRPIKRNRRRRRGRLR